MTGDNQDSRSQTTARDELPQITLRQFLKHLSEETVCDDGTLSASTLRMVLEDWRDHARRLHAELNQ